MWNPEKHDRFDQLHDRFTRGLPLDLDEQAELQAFYEELDAAEAQILAPFQRQLEEEVQVLQQREAQLYQDLGKVKTQLAHERERLQRQQEGNELLQRQTESLVVEYSRRGSVLATP